jgi:hypothetical protein
MPYEILPLTEGVCLFTYLLDAENQSSLMTNILAREQVKKIPLDVDTEEPHDCPAWRSQQEQRRRTQRRYYSCRKGCGQFIYFDANNKSQNGKWIPIDKETNEPHQCQ